MRLNAGAGAAKQVVTSLIALAMPGVMPLSGSKRA